uniref:Uncharacterized protein n=1 Tax=Salix viminalis TaxID=40686 RepID=A0A6N2KMH1_SALVM
MADTAGRTRLNREEKNRLKHACDAGMVSGEVPSDSEDSNNPLSSDSVRSESPPRLADLATSFRVFSESMAREEMIKAREASRLEAEKRRVELEAELTRMMLQTQLQIASIVAGKGTSRKRKRVGEEEEGMPMSSRGGSLLVPHLYLLVLDLSVDCAVNAKIIGNYHYASHDNPFSCLFKLMIMIDHGD